MPARPEDGGDRLDDPAAVEGADDHADARRPKPPATCGGGLVDHLHEHVIGIDAGSFHAQLAGPTG
jgi:hypothetical protein